MADDVTYFLRSASFRLCSAMDEEEGEVHKFVPINVFEGTRSNVVSLLSYFAELVVCIRGEGWLMGGFYTCL